MHFREREARGARAGMRTKHECGHWARSRVQAVLSTLIFSTSIAMRCEQLLFIALNASVASDSAIVCISLSYKLVLISS